MCCVCIVVLGAIDLFSVFNAGFVGNINVGQLY